jgi:hypothetical protein
VAYHVLLFVFWRHGSASYRAVFSFVSICHEVMTCAKVAERLLAHKMLVCYILIAKMKGNALILKLKSK